MRGKNYYCTSLLLAIAACAKDGSRSSDPIAEATAGGLAVSSFSPTRGAAGSQVEILGSNFSGLPNGNTVKFKGATAHVQLATESYILAIVPFGAETGPITISNQAGAAATPAIFHVLPSVTEVSPVSAPVEGQVTIRGNGFDAADADANVVTFDGLQASVANASKDEVVASVPFGARTGPLALATVEGSVVASPSYTILPSITATFPPFGPPGTPVRIEGSNFRDDPAQNAVTFNGVPAPVLASSYAAIQTLVPAGAASGPLLVTTPDGTATGNFVIPIPPLVTGFQPVSGIVGTTVQIQGSGFIPFPGENQVFFNGVPASVTGQTLATIDALVPNPTSPLGGCEMT